MSGGNQLKASRGKNQVTLSNPYHLDQITVTTGAVSGTSAKFNMALTGP
jgi:hypothetical protein